MGRSRRQGQACSVERDEARIDDADVVAEAEMLAQSVK